MTLSRQARKFLFSVFSVILLHDILHCFSEANHRDLRTTPVSALQSLQCQCHHHHPHPPPGPPPSYATLPPHHQPC